jgi:hypothetical protein
MLDVASGCGVPKLASCLQIADFSGSAPSFGTPHANISVAAVGREGWIGAMAFSFSGAPAEHGFSTPPIDRDEIRSYMRESADPAVRSGFSHPTGRGVPPVGQVQE